MYLTSESENVIEQLENDHIYVIGGLVDHNCQKVSFFFKVFDIILIVSRIHVLHNIILLHLCFSLKGICHKLAVSNGIKHARLPLDKFLEMKARKVLTVDHGNDINSTLAIFNELHFAKCNILFSVFEILIRVTEGKSWQEAFLHVLPERKNAQPVPVKDSLQESDTTEDNEVKSEEPNQ